MNYFVWNCLTCFSNTKIGSVTSFSILFNFQGPVAPQPSGWQLNYFTTEVVFCQALFFRSFSFLAELGASRKSLAFLPDFLASIGSFRFTSSRDSEVILLSQRLALKYNTTPPAFCQHFSASFFYVFCKPFRCAEIVLIWMSSASRWASSEVASFIFAACPERSFQMTGSRCGPVPDFPI